MDVALLKRLIIPLVIACAVMFSLHFYLMWDGFFLGMGINLLTILVSLLFIETIQRKVYRTKRDPAIRRVRGRLQNIVNSGVSSCRLALGYGSDIIQPRFRNGVPSRDDLHAEVLRVAEHIVEPYSVDKAAEMNRKQWSTFATNIGLVSTAIDTAFSSLGSLLDPDVVAALIDAQDEIHGLTGLYSTWPDILGVPDEELPFNRSGESSVPLKRGLTELAGQRIAELSRKLRGVSAVAELGDTE